MTSGKQDVAASVAARLLDQAKATGDDYQILLTAYGYDRYLDILNEGTTTPPS